MRTKSELLMEMGILEVVTQCQYAEVSFSNIEHKITSPKTIPLVFSSIHSFLSHCAVLSRLLESPALARNDEKKTLAELIGTTHNLNILDRTFRNRLEHYDEYLEKWINGKNPDVSIMDQNVGPKSSFRTKINTVTVRHYDPDTFQYTLLDEDIDIKEMLRDVQQVKALAKNWLHQNRGWPLVANF